MSSAPDFPRATVRDEPLRVVLLWKRLSAHSAACVRALVSSGAEIWSTHQEASDSAPYDESEWGFPSNGWNDRPDLTAIDRAIDELDPHALVVVSWNLDGYRAIARRNPDGPIRVLCMDNQWLGTPKQRAASATSRWYLRPTFDVAWVPGDGAFEFARRLGFGTRDIWWGQYSGDVDAFAPIAADRGGDPPPTSFLFVGRLVRDKGIDILASAYRRYRQRVADPWPLTVAGTGDLDQLLERIPGVRMLGFVQPTELPEVMRAAGCLVLPSRFEPWGVVVHEATIAGLPVITTEACGAARRLVFDGHNGRVIAAGDDEALADALVEHTSSTPEQRRRQSARSQQLSVQMSPDRWVETLVTGTNRALAARPS